MNDVMVEKCAHIEARNVLPPRVYAAAALIRAIDMASNSYMMRRVFEANNWGGWGN